MVNKQNEKMKYFFKFIYSNFFQIKLEFDLNADGFDMINHINDGMSRWSSLDKRVELVTKTAHYIMS